MTHRHSILVVEDDPDISESLRDVLESEGYPVITAANGAEALRSLSELGQPCLIFLDMMMPVMSGDEFLTLLRKQERFSEVPVVIVSAWANETRAARALSQGFVKKPASVAALLEAAGGFCGLRDSHLSGEARGAAP